MRILIVHNYYQDAGGEDVVFQQESTALPKIRGYDIQTLTFRNKKGWRGAWQFLWSPWNIFAANKLKKHIRTFRPDVIHIHNTQYACGPILIRTAKNAGIPVVMSLHNFRLLCPSATLFHRGQLFTKSIKASFPWYAIRQKVLDNSLLKTAWTAISYWLHRKLGTWQYVSRYLVLADFSKRLIESSSLEINPDQILVKPNFVKIQAFDEPVTERSDDFLYVGRLSAEKGILELMQALANTSHTLKIAGAGPLQQDVDRLVSQNANFSYLGSLTKEAVYQEMRGCKALIVPSLCYEGGAPLTIIEAMMVGTPIVASKLGAIADVVIDNETGYTFDPTQASSIVAALDQLENDSSTHRSAMAKKAKTFALGHYSEQHIMTILQHIYDQVSSTNA